MPMVCLSSEANRPLVALYVELFFQLLPGILVVGFHQYHFHTHRVAETELLDLCNFQVLAFGIVLVQLARRILLLLVGAAGKQRQRQQYYQ